MKVSVRVIPKAKKERIQDTEQGLKVYMCEPAVEGKANRKLIEMLADFFNVKKYNIEIVKGHKQRDKIIEISKEGEK